MNKCVWTPERDWGEDLGTWNTSCGNAFKIIDGTPKENEFRFCCYCGKPLEQNDNTEKEGKE